MVKNIKNKGVLLTELAIFIAILGILLTCMALLLNGFRKSNHYQLTRQQCTAAAQAELESIAVTGQAIDEEDFKRLWPKLSVSIEKTDGSGQWKEMKLIKVKTKAKSYTRDVEIELSRYVLAEQEK